jgi:hypothetical protein
MWNGFWGLMCESELVLCGMRWRSVVKTAMNLQVPWNLPTTRYSRGNLLLAVGLNRSFSFSLLTLLHSVFSSCLWSFIEATGRPTALSVKYRATSWLTGLWLQVFVWCPLAPQSFVLCRIVPLTVYAGDRTDNLKLACYLSLVSRLKIRGFTPSFPHMSSWHDAEDFFFLLYVHLSCRLLELLWFVHPEKMALCFASYSTMLPYVSPVLALELSRFFHAV